MVYLTKEDRLLPIKPKGLPYEKPTDWKANIFKTYQVKLTLC